MKSTCHSNLGWSVFLWIMSMLSGLLLCSCSTTSPPNQASHQRSSSDWVQVRSYPPTWYPRGVSADCPTDYQHGEWVYTWDSEDTRYFIPLRGLSAERRTKLRNEAMAARNPDKMNQINRKVLREDSTRAAKQCATSLVYLTPLGLFVAMSQIPYDPAKQGYSGYGGFGGFGGIQPSLGNLGNCAGVGAGGCNVGGGGH